MKRASLLLIVFCLGLAGCKNKHSERWKTGIIKDEFIFKKAPFQSCHASTIAETKYGLIAAWFGGTREGNPDIGIWVSRKDKGSQEWTKPAEVANGVQNDSTRYPCWNPVLFRP